MPLKVPFALSAAILMSVTVNLPEAQALNSGRPAQMTSLLAGHKSTPGYKTAQGQKPAGTTTRVTATPDNFAVTHWQCELAVDAVDKNVRKHFYSSERAQNVWGDYLARNRSDICSSRSLRQLSEKINAGLKTLKSSHCQFITRNDEIYFFLHSMFSKFNSKIPRYDIDYVGAIAGGVKSQPDEVRYVLDESPAQKAGIKIGDRILAVDGYPYSGQKSFWGKSGKPVSLLLERSNRKLSLSLVPEKKDNYRQYVEAIVKSARTFQVPGATLGYVHLWCAGQDAHDAFVRVIADKLSQTDGLILDLRDGYGANGLDDLDPFYRPAVAYPEFTTIDRDGKRRASKDYYDKPVVAIINGGVRSGKKLLAFSLKRSKRATVVGERTSGAVVAGSLFPVNERMSLYLAVLDAEVGGVRLEGQGVNPDIEIAGQCSQQLWDRQLAEATRTLVDQLRAGR